MGGTQSHDKNYSISAKQAGTFLGALVVALVLGLANALGTGDNGATYPTKAEFDALTELVRGNSEAIRADRKDTENLWGHHKELEIVVLKHEEYSDEKVEEIARRFGELSTWQVTHESREEFQDRMISDCIRTLRGVQ